MSTTTNQNGMSVYETPSPWYVRAALWLESHLRPYLGWGPFTILIILATLPSYALRLNHWVSLEGQQAALDLMGPFCVVTVWIVAGWRSPRRKHGRGWAGAALMTVMVLVAGAIVVSQVTATWIPGPRQWFHAALSGTWSTVPEGVLADWARLAGRIQFWWAGVRTETASQDNLVFLVVASTVVWLISALSAMLARRFGTGFLAAAPQLWLLGMILLYSDEGRILFVFGLGLAVLLHLLTDQNAMVARWSEEQLDYSPGLFLDRFMLVLGAGLLILTVAAAMPNLYIQAIVDRYYARMEPTYDFLESTAERLFPGIKGVSRFGGGVAGGLPNEFLLQAGPNLSDEVVMYVSTNDAPAYDYAVDAVPPTGHYMRGGTLANYDGHGWSNTVPTERLDIAANNPLANSYQGFSGLEAGRREVVQQVALAFNSQVLYAAAEPVEASADVRLEQRSPGDVVALWASEKSYTAVSLVPAVSEAELEATQSWGDAVPLPAGYELHLLLPDAVTERTRDLARSLTDGQPTMYAKARAIESYLRTFEYDLDVPAPPDDVADVADYFLFDLQRGYCDYYATAFVVLARSVGLPTRFATGFVPAHWNAPEGRWTITEAEAHSWPEVYFPGYGWIPFEPTAGRSELVRIGLPSSAGLGTSRSQDEQEQRPEQQLVWNWQMLVWLVPLGLLLWGTWRLLVRIRRRGEDPWQTLIRWGGRAGRPMASYETILEYGHGLADYVVGTQTERQDLARMAASEMRALSGAVSSLHYAPEAERVQASARASHHWERLRGYLRALRRY